ncbi:MAG: FAD-binding oxidoreductase, partial [Phycisphaerae bacterium]|nr:FAD-binding oxidoreductase [Phycisphaerae bacterium]
ESLEAAGPDEVGLFVGSEGLFGVALEITLRLLPRPESRHTLLAGYRRVEDAGDAVARIVATGLLPAAMEIMDALAIEAAEAAVGAGHPPGAEAVMIVELEGPAAEVEADQARLALTVGQTNPMAVRVAADDEEREMIWRGRKSAFSAVGRLSPDFIVQDGVVPRRHLGEALRRIGEMAERHELRVANVFHAGDGNLHPLILFDGREQGALARAERLAGEILRMCLELGGSITGEHGIGMEKRGFLPEMFSADDIDTMKRIRGACDPRGIANRGKMFPGAEAPALAQVGLHPLEKAGVISRE